MCSATLRDSRKKMYTYIVSSVMQIIHLIKHNAIPFMIKILSKIRMKVITTLTLRIYKNLQHIIFDDEIKQFFKYWQEK